MLETPRAAGLFRGNTLVAGFDSFFGEFLLTGLSCAACSGACPVASLATVTEMRVSMAARALVARPWVIVSPHRVLLVNVRSPAGTGRGTAARTGRRGANVHDRGRGYWTIRQPVGGEGGWDA